jgi:TetR/AcrR family transcriptional regulator, mexJK operon transcriptional repressor
METTLEAKPARRVPRGDKRRTELAVVTERVFLERGFIETTMQMIASCAGASKETLYRHFANKEALFSEIVSRKAALISGPESALARDGVPRRVLFDLGLGLLRVMTQGDACSLFSIVVAETARTPELGAIFYSKGPGTTLARLTAYLRSAAARGELRCRQPERAAKLFLGAVVANYHLLSLIGPPTARITDSDMRSHVRSAVTMFLARYGASPLRRRS